MGTSLQGKLPLRYLLCSSCFFWETLRQRSKEDETGGLWDRIISKIVLESDLELDLSYKLQFD